MPESRHSGEGFILFYAISYNLAAQNRLKDKMTTLGRTALLQIPPVVTIPNKGVATKLARLCIKAMMPIPMPVKARFVIIMGTMAKTRAQVKPVTKPKAAK